MSTDRICSIYGCTRPHDARGWCKVHWATWRRHGDPCWQPEKVTALERFLAKIHIDPDTGCWEWPGSRRKGYGSFRVQGTDIGTHRFAYESFVAPIPEGMIVCHHCDNPPCCNPDHLFVGTMSDNIRDMDRKGRRGGGTKKGFSLNKTHCLHGHAFTPENTYINARGWKFCRQCNRASGRASYAKRNPDKGIWPRYRTHCIHGHEFTPENTVWCGPDKTNRRCRQCKQASEKARYDLRKVAK